MEDRRVIRYQERCVRHRSDQVLVELGHAGDCRIHGEAYRRRGDRHFCHTVAEKVMIVFIFDWAL